MAEDRQTSPQTRSVHAGLRAWIITDGKAGDIVQCRGLAEAMGLEIEERIVSPRPPWSWIAPRGGPAPHDRPGRPGGALEGNPPDIAIASGRRAIPALRALKRTHGDSIFTIILKDPRCTPGFADALWVPRHDSLRGTSVLATTLAPHRLHDDVIARERDEPDARIATLKLPRTALLLGGDSDHFRVDADDIARIAALAISAARDGSVMVSGSRRTPPQVLGEIRAALETAFPEGSERTQRAFIWDGSSRNPYAAMIANAKRIAVTCDSTNMIGEACASDAPVYVIPLAGKGHRKIDAFIDALVDEGRVRRFSGSLEMFPVTPRNDTPAIAQDMMRRFEEFRARHAPS